MKDFLRLGIIMIPICAVIWFIAPEGQAPGIIAGFIVLVGLSAAPAQSRVRAIVLAHAREVRIAGGCAIALAACLFVAPILWPGAAPSENLTMAMALCALVAGLALLMMPASATRMEAVADQHRRGGATPLDPNESGPAEALRALCFVRDHPLALAKIVLPWGAIGIGVLLASVYVGTDLLKAHPSPTAGAAVLAMLLISVLALLLSYPMTALAWARFVAGHPASPFSPVRASGAYLWRFFVLWMVAKSFSNQFAPATAYLTNHMGLADSKSLDGLMLLGGYLMILFIFGPMALTLPAIAVGDAPRFSRLVPDFFRPGRRYALGLILAAAPFLGVNLIVEIASAYQPQSKGISPWTLLAIVPMLSTFLGVATVMTYLVQVYRKVRAETDVGAYEPFVADHLE